MELFRASFTYLPRHHDDAEVNRAGVFGQRLVAFDPEDFAAVEVDGDNWPFESVVNEIGHHRVTDLVRLAGSADHRDGLGI